MKKKLTKQMLLGVLAAAMFGISASEVEAQTFTNTGSGTYNATCNGVIRLKAATTATPAVQADISGNDLGTATKPIPGIVEWAAASGSQTVLAKYYQRMILTGASTKNVNTGVTIIGAACTETMLAGYTSMGTYPYYVQTETVAGEPARSGDVTYLPNGTNPGTFNYAATGTYNVFPTVTASGSITGVGAYGELNIGGTGTATVAATKTVTADHVISADGAPITVAGTFNLGAGASTINDNLSATGTGAINTGAGAVTLATTGALDLAGTSTLTTGAGDVTINGITNTADNTTITVGGDGDLTFSGNLTLAGDLIVPDGSAGNPRIVNLDGETSITASGTVNIGASDSLIVSNNVFTNAADGNNLTFACGASIVYDGTTANQPILPTLDADNHRYGNLILRGGNKVGGVAGTGTSYYDVAVCNNFSLAGGNLDMYKGGTNSANLIMNAPQTGTDFATNNGVMAYTGLAEVVGAVVRKTDGSAKTYTFNNSATSITLAAAATNPASMTLNVRPGQNPDTYVGTTDVKRDINLAYAGNTGDFEMTVKAGYLQSEAADKTGNSEDWPAAYTEGQIRFYEANGTASEKVGTGAVYDKVSSTGTTFGTVSLARIGSITDSPTTPVAIPNGISKFASGNDLVLRGGPTTFYSVRDGRWSNPNTWDEGTTPTSIDAVELRTTVYAGIVDLFGAGGNNIPETSLTNTADGMATTITVASKTGLPAANNPAFLLGNEDNGGTFVFKTTAVANGASPLTIINNNTTVPTGLAAFEVTGAGARTGIADKGSYGTNPGFSGIWVTPWTNAAGTNPVVLQTNQIENKGTVNNEGIIEVGQ